MNQSMRTSRTALIAMLVAVEMLLLGLMFVALRGDWSNGHAFISSGLHTASVSAKSYAPINAGASPLVRIDDPSDRVVITASNDGLVHVTDETRVWGVTWGDREIPGIAFARNPSGVTITRSAFHTLSIFGFDRERIEVALPNRSRVEITRCEGADITGVQNDVDVASQDGHITLTDIRGNVKAQSDDGHITATRLTGDSVALDTNDGSLRLRLINARSLEARTGDGRVEASGVVVTGRGAQAMLHTDDGSFTASGRFSPDGRYDFSTGDGSMRLALATAADVTVRASTSDGHIEVDGTRYGDDGAAKHEFNAGSGSGAMRLATQDGSIRITTNGAQ